MPTLTLTVDDWEAIEPFAETDGYDSVYEAIHEALNDAEESGIEGADQVSIDFGDDDAAVVRELADGCGLSLD